MFQFRLTFGHPRPGFFRFEEQRKIIEIENGGEALHLVARDADKLIDATRFHLEMEGFQDETSARARGNELRIHLQILNAALGLGLVVPTEDATSGSVSEEIKKKIEKEHYATILDTIVGLAVFPADGKHGEFVMAGRLETHASDPEYVLSALKALWPNKYSFNEHQSDALEIVGRATSEVSPRARFLLSYLALERMVTREKRSQSARDLLQTFVNEANKVLPEAEAKSLAGALSSLSIHSYPSALRQLAARIKEPKEIAGRSIEEFFSECVRVRNDIAHDANTNDAGQLAELSLNLQRTVLTLVWTECNLPPVTFNVPTSQVTVSSMQVRIL